jgi:hypothetical protein
MKKKNLIGKNLLLNTLGFSLPLVIATSPVNAVALGIITSSQSFDSLLITSDFVIDIWELFSLENDSNYNNSDLRSLSQILLKNSNRPTNSSNWLINTLSQLRMTPNQDNQDVDATPIMLGQTGLDNIGEGVYYFTTDLSGNNAQSQNNNSHNSPRVSLATYHNFLGFQGHSRVQFRDLRIVAIPQNNLILDVRPLWSTATINQNLGNQTYSAMRNNNTPVSYNNQTQNQNTTFKADSNVQNILDNSQISVPTTPNVNFRQNIPISPEQQELQKQLEKQQQENQKRLEKQRQELAKQMEKQRQQKEKEQQEKRKQQEKERERFIQEASKRR